MAIKCHSSFAHYHMFHNSHSHGGNNYGSIFNITNNCNGGHMNFWGGLGAGLGYGLGGMFSGLFGGFMGGMGNMFSGFGNMFGGFGNMFGGFGMPMFGGFGMGDMFGMGGWGNGLAGLFGGGRADRDDDGDSEYSSRRSRRSGSCDCGCKDKKTETVTDKDNGKINELVDKGDKLINAAKSADKSNDINALLKEIDEKYKKDNGYKFEDDINTLDNEKQLTLLIKRLKAAQMTKPTSPVESQGAGEDDGAGAGVADGTEPKVKINGAEVALKNLTREQIGSLTKEQIDGLNADQAKDLLGKLGLLCNDDSERDGVQATTSLNAIRLAEKANLSVALAHNIALDDIEGADPYINGKVSNINYNDQTKMITYNLEAENAIYKVECEAGSNKIKTIELVENKTNQYKSFQGAEYEIKPDDNDPYAVRNELPPSVKR